MKPIVKKCILCTTFFSVILLLSCRTHVECMVQEMSNEEIFERVKVADFTDKDVPIFAKNGKFVPKDSLLNYDKNKNALAFYKDCSGKVVKKMIRPITQEDLLYRKKIENIFHENIDVYVKYIKVSEKDSIKQKHWIDFAYYSMPLKARNIDCDSTSILLSNALNQDQENRALYISPQKDRQNQVLIKSIIDKCGFEAIEKQGKEAILATFMIAQHGQASLREEYFHYFENATKKNLLTKAALAIMIDRMLMEKGEPQLYGSQWEIDNTTGTNNLWSLKYPNRVNILRDSMGMPPLEEYMRSNNVKFKEK